MSLGHEELEQLLFDWETGELDEAGVERVREILRADEQARGYFLKHQMLTAALSQEAATGIASDGTNDVAGAKHPPQPSPAPNLAASWSQRLPLSLAAVAITLLAVVLGISWYNESTKPLAERESASNGANRRGGQEATSHGVALLTRLVDIEWSDDQRPLEVGDAVAPGRFAIDSGFAQVEFFCGATVVLEGPAELELKSPTLARVKRGRMRAQVPPAARGFALQVDDMTVVDLGTEFGLSVSDQGADVQVFDGEIEIQDPRAETKRLTAGQAVERSAAGAMSEALITPTEFVDIETLESRAAGQRAERYERWKTWSEAIRRDPRVVAYYACDDVATWRRKLSSSVSPANRELDGAIVGARRVPGRWPNKGGLEFKKPGDRVRIQVPGEYGSLTLACWVRIDSLDRWYNSLFLTDGYNQGEPHWQILDTGQLFFSVRPRAKGDMTGQAKPPEHREVLSPTFWKPSMSGKWLHLATTYDVDQARTTHYLNGELLHSESIPDPQLVKKTRIGAASIGNWSLPTRSDAEFAIRNLNGRLDEFILMSAALDAEEVKEMYQHGKP